MMKLYKVISKDLKAKDGGDFDYSKYLSKGKKPGKWLPKIKEVVECKQGYHVTPYWNMFIDNEHDRIFEVEVKGIKENTSDVGVIDKYVCQSIRLCKELIVTYKDDLNTGNRNTGDLNTGNWNTGYFNTITPKTILVFNKECDRELWNNCNKPSFIYFDLVDNDYKKSFQASFKKADKEDVALLLKLPNFDYVVFEEISGISKKMIIQKVQKK